MARQPDDGAQDRIHQPFVAASLLFGVLGGFSLAFSLPVEALVSSMDASWVAHAQVHGHLQVVGFATLFVIGMVFKLAPRFGGQRTMSLTGREPWVLWLLVAGLLARSFGQPLAESRLFGTIAVAGAAAEATAAAVFLVMVSLTLSKAVREWQPHALLLLGAAVGFLVQAVLGLWWVAELAADRRAIMPGAENAVLVQLQFFGVLLPAILGVGLRTFPTFFGRKPPTQRAGNVVAVLALLGITVWTVGGTLAAVGGGDWWALTVSGQALVGLAILSAIVAFGPWRTASRLAAASKGLAWSLHPALIALAATGVVLTFTAAQSALAQEATRFATLDAVRHLFGIGVITLAIVAMAQLILPEFASERLVAKPGAWRGPFFGAALSISAVLRGLVLLVGLEGEARWWAMAVAGGLGWLAVTVFAVLMWRAARGHSAYLQRIARARANQMTMAN